MALATSLLERTFIKTQKIKKQLIKQLELYLD